MEEPKKRQFSPAEQIPGDVWQIIFTLSDLGTLSNVASVSSFWNKRICLDPRWRTVYIQEFNELYRLFGNKIPPNMFKKKYLEMKRITREIKKFIATSTTKEPIVELFKSAVEKNSLEIVHALLKEKFLNINTTFLYRVFPYSAYCSDSTLVYYAAMEKKLDMVKLLLLHGADVTKKVTWYGSSARQNGPSMLHSSSHMILGDLFLSYSLQGLVCIGHAEQLLLHNDFDSAIKFLEISYQYDPQIISEYMEQVNQDKIGFQFNYSEDILTTLQDCFQSISDKPREKSCLIL